MTDSAFAFNAGGLAEAIRLLGDTARGEATLPDHLPGEGMGEQAALDTLAPAALGQAARLGTETAFAHMDPPTPWIAWATTQWNASLNQNLLHPATSPFAGGAEARVIDWLAPFFGMDGGHMVPGSTVGNLTALWAARDVAGVRRVVASEGSHNSVAKSAHVLGLAFQTVPMDSEGRLDPRAMPDLADACLVLTAGTTNAGAIDPLDPAATGTAAWTHVDAAWAGPLTLTCHAGRLAGIEQADSVAVSAHKWLYQPKESALLFFRETGTAHRALSFGGSYLAKPNVGLLGSHGAAAIPLLATLLAWGRKGMAARIEANMAQAETLSDWVASRADLELFAPNRSGVVLWRAPGVDTADLHARLPAGVASTSTLGETTWLRNVAANPNADIALIIRYLEAALDG